MDKLTLITYALQTHDKGTREMASKNCLVKSQLINFCDHLKHALPSAVDLTAHATLCQRHHLSYSRNIFLFIMYCLNEREGFWNFADPSLRLPQTIRTVRVLSPYYFFSNLFPSMRKLVPTEKKVGA